MLLLDGKAVTAKQLSHEYKVPLGKLEKYRLFELNNIAKALDLGETKQKGRIVYRKPLGKQEPAVFMFKDHDGLDHELRYCTSAPVDRKVGDKLQKVYSPRTVRVRGEGSMASNMDMAVFMYLHPKNFQSPFRTGPRWKWIYDDKEEAAKRDVDSIDVLFEALSHAKNLDGNDMILFAKGMGITGIKNMTEVELRAKLSKIAKDNPDKYMEKASSRTIFYDGRIQDAIDLGVFVPVSKGGSTIWKWGKGPHEGSEIVRSANNQTDPVTLLKNFLKENINDYYDLIMSAHKTATSSLSAEDFLKNKETGSVPVQEKPAAGYTALPTDFKGAQSLLRMAHPQQKDPAPARAAAFLKAINSGEITDANINEKKMEYISKIEE